MYKFISLSVVGSREPGHCLETESQITWFAAH